MDILVMLTAVLILMGLIMIGLPLIISFFFSLVALLITVAMFLWDLFTKKGGK